MLASYLAGNSIGRGGKGRGGGTQESSSRARVRRGRRETKKLQTRKTGFARNKASVRRERRDQP